MKRRLLCCVTLASFLWIVCAGCDMFTQEVPPEKLPPVPEKCVSLQNLHKNALRAAYSSVQASQMQVTRVANEFAQCMQDEGLSRAEAKGILKKDEAEARQEVEEAPDSDIAVPY